MISDIYFSEQIFDIENFDKKCQIQLKLRPIGTTYLQNMYLKKKNIFFLSKFLINFITKNKIISSNDLIQIEYKKNVIFKKKIS